MTTAYINGIEIAYRDEGTGDPLVLIHAFPLHSGMWEQQFRALASQRRIIAPDMRGFGGSAPGTGMESLDQSADDLAGLLDYLGLERVLLGGLSMGGYISFAFLRRYGSRVSGLILADTRPGPDGEEGRRAREINARLAEEQGIGALVTKMLPGLMAPGISAELRAGVQTMAQNNHPAGIAAALRAMAIRPDSTPQLASITVPTLIIVGAEDALTPPAEARAMHAAISGSRLIEIPGAGHLTNLEQPEAFNVAIRGFVTSLI